MNGFMRYGCRVCREFVSGAVFFVFHTHSSSQLETCQLCVSLTPFESHVICSVQINGLRFVIGDRHRPRHFELPGHDFGETAGRKKNDGGKPDDYIRLTDWATE